MVGAGASSAAPGEGAPGEGAATGLSGAAGSAGCGDELIVMEMDGEKWEK
jgi:hypothetical protein